MRQSDVNESTHFRSDDRVYCMNGKWFYQTRESDHGPFPSREAASADLARYVDEMKYFDDISPEDAKLTPKSQTEGYASFSLVDKGIPH